MKSKFVVFAVLLFVSFTLQAKTFLPGKHFIEVEGFQNQNNTITEYFSFYCPACFQQEPFMQMIKAELPPNVTFVRSHIDSMPGRDSNVQQMLTKAAIVAAHLGVEDQVVKQIFEHIHVSREDFTSLEQIADLFVQSGAERRDFLRTYNSFGISAKARQKQQNNQKLVAQGVTSVPTLIINGKYKPVLSDISSVEEYKALVLFLVNKSA